MTESQRRTRGIRTRLLQLAGRLLRWVFGPRTVWYFTVPSILIVLFVGVAGVFVVSGYLSGSIKADALDEARRDVAWAADVVSTHVSQEQLSVPAWGDQYLDLDRVVREHVKHPGVSRVKIWSPSGQIIYSDEASLVGRSFAVGGEMAEALRGETASEVSDLKAEENVAERQRDRMLETYAPIRLGDSPEVVAVLEVYEDYGRVAASIEKSQRTVYMAAAAGFVAIYTVLFIIHRWGASIMGRQRNELLRQSEEIELSYRSSLVALGSALDLRDHNTEGHCERVSELAITVGREMGMGDDELEELSRAAIVHDIGKMSLQDAVLCKPGPLTDEEWEEMRKHPRMGYEILKKIPVLRQAAEIVYAHHERYDGTGYPRGLKGREILLAARIFAVVDAYDAITTDRPYRAATSHTDAMAEIRRCSGTQFDPEVVRAFCEAERKGLVGALRPERALAAAPG